MTEREIELHPNQQTNAGEVVFGYLDVYPEKEGRGPSARLVAYVHAEDVSHTHTLRAGEGFTVLDQTWKVKEIKDISAPADTHYHWVVTISRVM